MPRKPCAVGIDLGTTYSAVAYIDDAGRSAIVRNSEGEILTPSVVLFDREEVVVGRDAKKVSALRSDSVAECAKRDMGQPAYSKAINGHWIPPEVIQSCILQKLKQDTIASQGPYFQCVITVPAYFDEPRRKATVDAGEMAGLEVLDIVNEPTAAALAFSETMGYLSEAGSANRPMKVLVYDLGGGTFDVTLIHLRPGDIQTLATDGDVQLGGRDWDMRLVDYAATQFQQRVGSDPRKYPASLASLLREAEEVKHTLSVRDHATLHLSHGVQSLDVPVTRQQFEEMTEDLLERTAYTTRQVMAAARLDWKDIDRVLLVGGSTRMPMVERIIKRISGITPDHSVHPDEAVARGAAIFARYLVALRNPNTESTLRVGDVNSHTLGIEGIDPATNRKENMFVIPRNSRLPVKVTKKCITRTANQRSVVVQVLEGESKVPEQCSAIGRAVLRGLPEHLPQGAPIDVTYEYGTNGRLDVRARMTGDSKREVMIELVREQGLSPDAIGRWKSVVTLPKSGFDIFSKVLQAQGHPVPGSMTPGATPTTTAPVALMPDVAMSNNMSPADAIVIAQFAPPSAPFAQPQASPPAAMAARPLPPNMLPQQMPQQFPPAPPATRPAMPPMAQSPLAASSQPVGNGPFVLKIVGLVAAITIGLAVGYYILVLLTHWNPLHIKLPGVHTQRPAVQAPADGDANSDATDKPAAEPDTRARTRTNAL